MTHFTPVQTKFLCSLLAVLDLTFESDRAPTITLLNWQKFDGTPKPPFDKKCHVGFWDMRLRDISNGYFDPDRKVVCTTTGAEHSVRSGDYLALWDWRAMARPTETFPLAMSPAANPLPFFNPQDSPEGACFLLSCGAGIRGEECQKCSRSQQATS